MSPASFRINYSSPPASTASVDNSTLSDIDIYFQEQGSHDTGGSDSDSDSGDSEATLDDIGIYQFGHPLERMFRLESTHQNSIFRSIVSSPTCSSVSSSSAASSPFYDTRYEVLVDRILAQTPSLATDAFNMLISAPSPEDSVMIKCLPRDSLELCILIELNRSEQRHDPWNPAPHVRGIVERDSTVFVVMERLSVYDDPPLKTVANYIDLFRQILEGLTFMHELSIARLSFQDPYCCMVDLGSAPSSCLSPAEFDRARYPVKYYFTDFSLAEKFGGSDTRSSESLFRRDVQDCALKIDRWLTYVPQVAPKFKTLVKAMTIGGFGAEDSRKLFEALCKSLESSIFDTPASSPEPCIRSRSSYALRTSTGTPAKQSLSS